jgi:putative PIN family toxin of toxin-antitoxin system
VIDTNIWLSGLIFGGIPERVLNLFVNGDVAVVTSEELLSELQRTVRQKFPLFVPQLAMLVALIREKAFVVSLGSVTMSASRDEDDNRVLETAVIGNCDYIVSGDKDLLVLKEFEGIPIVTPAKFLANYTT